MTSRDVTFTTTGRPAGIRSSLALLNMFDGSESEYSSCHHHWRPVMFIVIASAICGDAVARPTDTLATSHTNSTTTVVPAAAVTQRAMTMSDDCLALFRLTARTSITMTTVNTATAMPKISHHSDSMAPACGPAASSTDWETVA